MRKVSSLARMKSGSSIIPMINVSFVIILILMLIAPFLGESQIKIELPETMTNEVRGERKISLTISKSGELALEDKQINFSELSTYLKNRIALDPAQVLVIKADKSVPYQWVREAIEVGKESGIRKIAIATEPIGFTHGDKGDELP